VAAERALAELVDETCRGHAVADDNEWLAHAGQTKKAAA